MAVGREVAVRLADGATHTRGARRRAPSGSPTVGAMATTDRQILMEPERIRALAHPLRLQLLELLHDKGEQTATQCAEATGESVASCSFHLRMLGKYGFVERGDRRGREKPWRLVATGGFSTDANPEIPGAVAATTELALLTLSRRVPAVQAAFSRLTGEPEDWLDATSLVTVGMWLTAAETSELRDKLTALLDDFRDRQEAGQAPPGARHVHALLTLHSDPPEDDSEQS